MSSSVYLFQTTNSSDMPVTPGSFDPVYNGESDVHPAKLTLT